MTNPASKMLNNISKLVCVSLQAVVKTWAWRHWVQDRRISKLIFMAKLPRLRLVFSTLLLYSPNVPACIITHKRTRLVFYFLIKRWKPIFCWVYITRLKIITCCNVVENRTMYCCVVVVQVCQQHIYFKIKISISRNHYLI